MKLNVNQLIDITDQELRKTLITCDGKGKEIKEQCLEEILYRYVDKNKSADASELKKLVLELFSILEATEESDSGREFHPTTIRSCRCMVTARLQDMMPKMKELASK